MFKYYGFIYDGKYMLIKIGSVETRWYLTISASQIFSIPNFYLNKSR